MPSSSQSRLEHRKNSKADDGNGKHKELDGQSDEHFGDADLFAGQTGGSLAAPSNSRGESHSGDGGSCQHDNWTPCREKKPVEHTIQSNDHAFVPEVVIVNVELPRNPLRACLVKTRDLIHSRDGESHQNENRYTGNDYETHNFS